jgi:hypothetical protein
MARDLIARPLAATGDDREKLRTRARIYASITCQEIFEGFPDHVEQGGRLVTLRQWHDSSLRDLCFGELFSLWRTGAMRIVASAIFRRFGVPSPDIEALRHL